MKVQFDWTSLIFICNTTFTRVFIYLYFILYLYLIFGTCKASTVITWIKPKTQCGGYSEAYVRHLRFLHTVARPLSPLSVSKSGKDQSVKCLN